MFKKWNINDTPEITIPEMNENLDAIENALKVAELDNLVVNGDFSDGTNGWSSMLANTPVVSDGVLTFRATSQWGQVNCNSIPMKKDEKMYYKVVVKSDAKVWLSHDGAAYPPQHSGNGQWEILSIVKTIPKDTLSGRTGVIDSRTSDWTDIQIKDVMIINLTQTFGAGKEPSKEFCDSIMEVVGWFDGKYDLTTQEMFIIIAKWSQAQNVNQIMTLPNFDETE